MVAFMTQSSGVTSELLDRLPPQSLDAERGVIGSLLLDPRLVTDVAAVLKPEDFYGDAHRRLYGAILGLHEAGLRIDVVTLRERLTAAGEWEAAGGGVGVAEAMHAAPVSSHAVYHAQIVREKACRRRVILWAMDALRDAYDPTSELSDVLAAAEVGLMRAQVSDVADAPRLWMDVVAQVQVEVEEAMRRGRGGGVMTGLLEFDCQHGGFWPGELVLLGARPSVGKSALAMQVGAHVARHGLVYVASLEMRATELAMRAVCGEAGLSSTVVRTGSLTQDQCSAIVDGSNAVAAAKFVVHDRPGLSVSDIRSQVRRLKPKGLRLVIVDYIGLMKVSDSRASRNEQVTELSKGLKELAREAEVPVLAVSQLSRQGAGERPQLHHLRDSGSLEQDADVVLLLHRPKDRFTDEAKTQAWDAELEVAKARNGPVGILRLDWDSTRLRFGGMELATWPELDQFAR